METQTHIVYRNRIEHDVYESGLLIPIVLAMVAFLVVFVTTQKIVEKVAGWRVGQSQFTLGGCGIAGLIAAATVFKYFLI